MTLKTLDMMGDQGTEKSLRYTRPRKSDNPLFATMLRIAKDNPDLLVRHQPDLTHHDRAWLNIHDVHAVLWNIRETGTNVMFIDQNMALCDKNRTLRQTICDSVKAVVDSFQSQAGKWFVIYQNAGTGSVDFLELRRDQVQYLVDRAGDVQGWLETIGLPPYHQDRLDECLFPF